MTLNRVTAPARRVRSALCVEHALRGDEQELRVRVTPHAFMSCVQRPRRTLSNVWRPRVAVGCRYWLQIPGDKPTDLVPDAAAHCKVRSNLKVVS